MPEGPELRLSSIFINEVSSKYTFGGKVVKGEKATKLDDVPFEADTYTINAESRGKELKVRNLVMYGPNICEGFLSFTISQFHFIIYIQFL